MVKSKLEMRMKRAKGTVGQEATLQSEKNGGVFLVTSSIGFSSLHQIHIHTTIQKRHLPFDIVPVDKRRLGICNNDKKLYSTLHQVVLWVVNMVYDENREVRLGRSGIEEIRIRHVPGIVVPS